MRRCVSIAAVLVVGILVGGAITVFAAPGQRPEVTDQQASPSVDVELVIAVDISYSMDPDELAVQREGYAQAIVSKEFLQALRTGPNSKISVTYFEWSASSDHKIVIPWRVNRRSRDSRCRRQRNHPDTHPPGIAYLDLRRHPVRAAVVRPESLSRAAARH